MRSSSQGLRADLRCAGCGGPLQQQKIGDAIEAQLKVDQRQRLGVGRNLMQIHVAMHVPQRLARQLCANCKRVADVPDSVREADNLWGAELYEPVGCMRCADTSYSGRIGLFQVGTLFCT